MCKKMGLGCIELWHWDLHCMGFGMMVGCFSIA